MSKIAPRLTCAVCVTILFFHNIELHAVSLTSHPTVVSTGRPSPLSGLLTISTDVPSELTFEVRGAGEAWRIRSTSVATEHSVPILGLLSATEFSVENITLRADDRSETRWARSLKLTTPPLPLDFPTLHVASSAPEHMEKGFTFVPWLQRRGGKIINGGEVTQNYSFATDATGNVRWYTRNRMNTAHQLPNGNLFGQFSGQLAEIDLLGNVISSWHHHATRNPIENGKLVNDPGGWHHDHVQMPNGNMLTFSRGVQSVEHFPTSDADPSARATAEVQFDPLVEFTPEGEVVERWNLLDILDPTRIGFDALRDVGPHAWAHNNAVVYDATDNSLLVSMRNQDAIVKFSRSTGQLEWILGPHDNWGPEFQEFLLTPTGSRLRVALPYSLPVTHARWELAGL